MWVTEALDPLLTGGAQLEPLQRGKIRDLW